MVGATFMNPPPATNSARIKDLLDLPCEAGPTAVYECLMGCLTEGLGYEPIRASRVPGKGTRYRAGWRSSKGAVFTGEGPSAREASLIAALQLIEESEDALMLSAYAEPELREFPAPARRTEASSVSFRRQVVWPE